MSILAGGYPHPILTSETKGGQPSQSITMLNLAAATRWMAEGIGGARVNNGMPKVHPGTPMMGRYLPGHDHSGGLMGVPQKHTVWSVWFGYMEGADTSYVQCPKITVDTNIIAPEALVDTVTRNIFVPGGKAYQTLELEVFIYATAAADYTITVYGGNGNGPYSDAGTLSAGDNFITVDDGPIPFVPGRVNSMQWRVAFDYAGVSADVHLVGAALHQVTNTV